MSKYKYLSSLIGFGIYWYKTNFDQMAKKCLAKWLINGNLAK